MNGNDYICYKGDMDKPCYLITIPNSNTVIQILNSGSFSDEIVEDAVKQSFFYIGNKAPDKEFTVVPGEVAVTEDTVDSEDVDTGVQAGGSVTVENSDNTYGKVGDTISYKVGEDIRVGAYSVFVVEGDDCTVQLTPRNTDMEPVTVSHESLVVGMYLNMEDGDTLTVTNGIVTLK